VHQVVGGEHALAGDRLHVEGLGAHQLEAVIVDGDAEGVRAIARQPPGDEAGQAEMHVAPGERVDVQVLAFA
jgi:hypothetical protein